MSDKPGTGSPPTIATSPPSVPARPGSPEIEEYTPERIAEFLLSNAVSDRDYAWACEEVRRMGLDPEKIPHYRPAGGALRGPPGAGCQRALPRGAVTSQALDVEVR